MNSEGKLGVAGKILVELKAGLHLKAMFSYIVNKGKKIQIFRKVKDKS